MLISQTAVGRFQCHFIFTLLMKKFLGEKYGIGNQLIVDLLRDVRKGKLVHEFLNERCENQNSNTPII